MWTKFVQFAGPPLLAATAVTVLDTYLEQSFLLRLVRAAEPYIPPPPVPNTKWDSNWDKREPESLVKPKVLESLNDAQSKKATLEKYTSKASRHIFLIRHGHYDLSGQTDKEQKLTKTGIEQSHLTGKRLKELGVKFNILLNSTMSRAIETADIICEELSEEVAKRDVDPLLVEGAPYPPEPPIPNWAYAHDFQVDGARIEAAFRKYFHRAEPSQLNDSIEVFVCHGNVIRYFCCRALQLPPEGWLRFSVAHCSITWILIKPNGRVVLRALGDSGHLPPDLVTL